ncbi:MAG TPA: oligoendopeptidase F, partial [Firmicutes bacterium]|nr:oligoendopeptidase F [Bacillota bacterium]
MWMEGAMVGMSRRLLRSEVPVEDTWRLADLFASVEEWERVLASVDAEIAGVARFRGRLGEGGAVLLECLEASDTLGRRVLPA